MGVEIYLKFTGLYFVMFSFYAATAGNIDPVLEVVSIYNDDFTTPDSREPYFIKVHRCVDHYSAHCSQDDFAIPKNYTRIQIVVPDLNNRAKFYRYVVYNHTSCKCAGDPKATKLNGEMQEVNELEFRNGYRYNPVNLRDKRGFCDQPQPRFRQHTDFERLYPQSRYYLQHQCLPGCLHESEVTTTGVVGPGGFTETRTFSRDKNCKAYAPSREPHSKDNCTTGHMQQSNPAPQNLFGSKKSSTNESNGNLIISIGSARLLLAALVLSFVLLIVLMLDFGLCRKKKGFFYALCSCSGNNNAEDFSNNYKQRRVNEVTV